MLILWILRTTFAITLFHGVREDGHEYAFRSSEVREGGYDYLFHTLRVRATGYGHAVNPWRAREIGIHGLSILEPGLVCIILKRYAAG
jgi:hypothetical protein